MLSTLQVRSNGSRRGIGRRLAKRQRGQAFAKPRKLHGEVDTSPSDKRTLWFVTQNTHKYEEARRTLDPFGIRIHKLGSPKTEIQSTDLSDIAKFAAEEAAEKYNRTVLVEDSGLFVKTLNGFPGPYSSFVHATIGVEGLVRLMSQKLRREAYFQASWSLHHQEAPVKSSQEGHTVPYRTSLLEYRVFGLIRFSFQRALRKHLPRVETNSRIDIHTGL